MTHFKNYTDRFFFLYGKTKDEFYTSDIKLLDLEKVLHKHFLKNDYKRIVYYQGTKGVYCYDKYSFDITFSKKHNNLTMQNKDVVKNKVLGGVLGRRLKKDKDNSMIQDIKELTKKMQDVDVVNHFDYIIKDESIKTVVIFSDFNDFLLHTQRETIRNFSTKISDWDGLPSSNHNIVLFIVPDNLSLNGIKNITNRYDHWQILTSKIFSSNGENNLTPSKHMIMMEYPYKDEVKNLINFLRFRKDLKVDWFEFDKSLDLIMRLLKEKNIFLKELSVKLQELSVFNKKQINIIFNIKNEKTGLEKLKQMNGLEYLATEIDKLVIYANSKKIADEEARSSEVKRVLPQNKKNKNEVNLHISLTGNPGTGKTTVAKIISEIFKENGILGVGHIVKVTRDDLVSSYVGQTAINTKEKINQAMGGVLFIDEAYTLSKGGENDFGKEAIDTILEAMSDREGEFSVIIAGYPDDMKEFLSSNAGLQRRFANKIHLNDYKPDVLINIFKEKMQKEEYSLSQELEDIFQHFIKNFFDARDEKTFGNAGDILNLFDKMAQNAIYKNRKELCIIDVPEELKKHLKKQSDDVMADALAKLDNIVGLESVKENIRRIIASIKMSKLRDINTHISAGHYIFKGNPGTGKTTVARIFGEILKELKVLKKGNFTETTREDLVQGYVGQTATKTKEVLEKSLGGVLFIDEAYSLSTGGENDFGKEAINTIVPFMENNADNFTLIVAGYDKEMDVFLDANTGLKSRFTNTIVFEDYTGSEMLKIFKIFSKGYILGESVDDKLLSIFDKLKQNSTHFGNGRDARKLFDLVRTNLDMRLNNLDDLVHGDKRLNIIELEDLDNC